MIKIITFFITITFFISSPISGISRFPRARYIAHFQKHKTKKDVKKTIKKERQVCTPSTIRKKVNPKNNH